MTLVKDGKTNLIQDRSHRYKNHYNRILQRGSEIGLSSKYDMGKWELSSQGARWGISGWKITKKTLQG